MTTVDKARPDQMYLSALFNKIMAERRFQDQKYGPVTGSGGHDLTGWLIVLKKELDEAFDAATGHGKQNRTGRNTVRAELIQIAAVACAALEQHGLDPEPWPKEMDTTLLEISMDPSAATTYREKHGDDI